jgi:hypothetical protein
MTRYPALRWMLAPPDQSNMAKFDPDGHTAPLPTKTEGAMPQIKYNPQQVSLDEPVSGCPACERPALPLRTTRHWDAEWWARSGERAPTRCYGRGFTVV